MWNWGAKRKIDHNKAMDYTSLDNYFSPRPAFGQRRMGHKPDRVKWWDLRARASFRMLISFSSRKQSTRIKREKNNQIATDGLTFFRSLDRRNFWGRQLRFDLRSELSVRQFYAISLEWLYGSLTVRLLSSSSLIAPGLQLDLASLSSQKLREETIHFASLRKISLN